MTATYAVLSAKLRQIQTWNTNLNKTLGGKNEQGKTDSFCVTPNSRFSLAYNDWGLGQSELGNKKYPQLGLGGDINGGAFQGPVTDSMVAAPANMIMLADSRALNVSIDVSQAGWEANLDRPRTVNGLQIATIGGATSCLPTAHARARRCGATCSTPRRIRCLEVGLE